MVQFRIVDLLRKFEDAEEFLTREDWPLFWKELGDTLEGLRSICCELKLNDTLLRQVDWVRAHYEGGPNNEAEIRTYLKQLIPSIRVELAKPLFFMIEEQDAAYYSTVTEQVSDRLRPALKDLDEAGKAFALERYTASVFHSMRAVEYSLRALAARLLFDLSEEQITYKAMGQLYAKVKDVLANTKANTPKGDQREAELRFLSDAADKCLFFMNLRDEAAHARKFFNRLEALNALSSVREFMDLFLRRLDAPD